MKTSKNTVLITGGGSGIGFEIAKLFSQNDNEIIITGRNEERLLKAAAKLDNTTAIACDITKAEDVNVLVDQLKKDFAGLNVVINNAGNASYYNLTSPEADGFNKASEEMNTNFLSVVRLNEKFLPLLTSQPDSAIVTVSSIVAFAPRTVLSTYAASKAALHSYTQSLRFALKDTSVKVFELMPPLVNTEFSKAIGGENGIPPAEVAQDLIKAFEEDHYEIHVGNTANIFKLFMSSPQSALEAMNQ